MHINLCMSLHDLHCQKKSLQFCTLFLKLVTGCLDVFKYLDLAGSNPGCCKTDHTTIRFHTVNVEGRKDSLCNIVINLFVPKSTLNLGNTLVWPSSWKPKKNNTKSRAGHTTIFTNFWPEKRCHVVATVLSGCPAQTKSPQTWRRAIGGTPVWL